MTALKAESPPESLYAARARRAGFQRQLWLAISAAVLLLAAMIASVALGTRPIPLPEVWGAAIGTAQPHVEQVVAARIPRTLLGVVVGAGLGVSGLLIQAVMRNPLAEPGLLGVTMGASASVVTAAAFSGLSLGLGAIGLAMPGALLAVAAVYLLGGRARSSSAVSLVLAGAVVSAVLGAYVQAMVLSRPEVFDSYRHWVVGSLAGAHFETLFTAAPFITAGLACAWSIAPALNQISLGDDLAHSLGVKVVLVRTIALAAAAVLAATATAAVGPIAFVGLVVPHLARALAGTDYRWLILQTVLLGAVLLLGADVAARVVARPQELMVGVVTAFIGAPFLLLAVRRGRITG